MAAIAWQHGESEIQFAATGATAFHGGSQVAADSLFRMFSQTKPVTGIAAMMLVEEGRLALDQPVATILPEFAAPQVRAAGQLTQTRPSAGPITIRHLLTHTAGFGYHIGGDDIAHLYWRHGLAPGARNRIPGPGEMPNPATLEELGSRLARLPLARDPGTRFEYSIAIDLLGLVIQRVAGMPFETFLQERLFDPLGMRDTGFNIPSEKLGRLTALCEKRWDGWKFVDDPKTSAYATPAVPSGGGGLVSSAEDYSRFASMLMQEGLYQGRRLLRAETVRLAASNLLPDGVGQVELPLGYVWPATGFGAAMSVQIVDGELPKGVFGWPGAAGTQVWIDPNRRFFLQFLVQYWPPEINLSLRPEVIAAAYADLNDPS
jgi:CubicO group peptidase (beta-lactamase class C family)